ncbi:mite group 2 allergen Tyr p 2-like [Dermacentor silvarum]|uniref:mite group 2 allergen Tyr p 2-like n=1 Tax=Dermacentor silvarum TaxID=543639 RepID=UPI00189771FD|nr:mite group 2 allergen Tyr p 2-like [Dermacentor silvarum]
MNGVTLGVFVFVATLSAAMAQVRNISFKSCGGMVKSVLIQPCSSEPCAIKRGDTARINMAFTSNQYSPTLVMGISAVLEDDLELRLPTSDNDGCRGKGIQCPLQQGSEYTFNYGLEVKPIYPKLNTTAKLKLTGARGIVACVLFPIRLVD